MYYFYFSYINVYLLMFPCIYIKGKTPYSISSRGRAFRTSSDQDHGACMFNGEQVNDHIEQDDHIENVVKIMVQIH